MVSSATATKRPNRAIRTTSLLVFKETADHYSKKEVCMYLADYAAPANGALQRRANERHLEGRRIIDDSLAMTVSRYAKPSNLARGV